MSTPVTAPGFFVSKSSGLFVGRLFSEPDKGVPVATPCYAHIILHKELIIIRFDSEIICIYASPNRFFLLDLARVQSLPSAAPTREEPRDAVSSGHGMCKTFSLSRQAENLSPRGRKEEEHERASHF